MTGDPRVGTVDVITEDEGMTKVESQRVLEYRIVETKKLEEGEWWRRQTFLLWVNKISNFFNRRLHVDPFFISQKSTKLRIALLTADLEASIYDFYNFDRGPPHPNYQLQEIYLSKETHDV